MAKFFEKIEHYIEMSMLATSAKQKLNKMTIKSTESINEYYHRLYKLWEYTNTPNSKQIDKFKLTVKPTISHALLATRYYNM